VGAAGGAGAFTVTAPDTCQWTAVSNAPDWLAITAGSTGTGTAPVSYNAAVNLGASSRTGTISVSTATFTLTQSAACSVTLSPAQITVSASAGSGTIRVTTNLQTCERPAYSDSAWLTITSGASDVGSGEVRYSYTANNSALPRTGSITIGSQTFIVTQIGSNCTISLSTTFASVPNTGGPGRVDVVTNCSWTASTDVNWIVITSGTSGTTNGSVIYQVARNPNPQPRSGIITIGGMQVVISQAATAQSGACNYAIAPVQGSLTAAGGTGQIAVTVEEGCTWSAATTVPWITITTGASGAGNGEVGYAAAANTSPSQRRGTIVIAGLTFTLVQEGTACTYALSPRSATFLAEGGTGSATVTSPCTWSAGSNRNWIAITTGSPGTGDGSFSYAVAANNSAVARSGAISVAGLTLDVSQSGLPCRVTLAKLSASLGAPGGSGTFGVTGTAGCDWTASSDAPWLKVTWAAVGGSGTVYYTAEANTSPGPRSARISVLDQVFALSQESGPVVASTGVVNGASFARTSLAPGLIVTVFGTMMGPEKLASYALTPDRTAIATELAGTRVLFGGVPAPILYTSAGQLSAIVPYAVAGQSSTRLVVEYNGVRSNAVDLPVAASAPAIFTLNASGTGQGAILNQNNTVNSTAAPAARNSVVQIFATGEGETTPDGLDGLLVPASAATRPKLPVTVRIGNVDATVTYAGSAPGMVAGLIQINARIAANAPLGDAVPVVVTIGGVASQPGVTMVVR
jgi:uncharacterized protein (TIGR03437 family)